MRRLKRALALGLCGLVAGGCAHAEPGAPGPQAPQAEAAKSDGPAPASEAPKTTLRVTSAPVEALRSPYFAALELTFENPSSEWHEVRRVVISPERQLFGPALETLIGARLRAWQLASREARRSSDGPAHPALQNLAPEAPVNAEAASSTSAAPPEHLLAGPFMVAPGLLTRKWIVLYSPAKDGLVGQDLMLAYELENGHVERVLIHYPKPAAARE